MPRLINGCAKSPFIIALICFASFARVFIPALPGHSATFDCDDAALSMYHHFTSIGINATPVMGDLHSTGEQWGDCNHAWLIINIAGQDIAYDWGKPRFDPQHYEVYPITIEDLSIQNDIDRSLMEAK